jgi:hypothetical protein
MMHRLRGLLLGIKALTDLDHRRGMEVTHTNPCVMPKRDNTCGDAVAICDEIWPTAPRTNKLRGVALARQALNKYAHGAKGKEGGD